MRRYAAKRRYKCTCCQWEDDPGAARAQGKAEAAAGAAEREEEVKPSDGDSYDDAQWENHYEEHGGEG